MKYLVPNYTTPEDMRTAVKVRAAADGDAWGAYTRAPVDAGVLVGGGFSRGPMPQPGTSFAGST